MSLGITKLKFISYGIFVYYIKLTREALSSLFIIDSFLKDGKRKEGCLFNIKFKVIPKPRSTKRYRLFTHCQFSDRVAKHVLAVIFSFLKFLVEFLP